MWIRLNSHKLVNNTLQTDSLPSEPPGMPKNTGVDSLSLLQGTFLTQELNRGLLHCRQILYQLSYQGSPSIMRDGSKVEWVERSVPGMTQKCTWCLDSIAMNWTECWWGHPGGEGTGQYSKSPTFKWVLFQEPAHKSNLFIKFNKVSLGTQHNQLYIGLYYNRLIIFFTQVIHKKQTRK